MKRYYSFLILTLLFSRVSVAQHWEQLGKGSYELEGAPIRTVYADSSGHVYAGTGIMHENFTKGSFFKCTNTSIEEPKNFPYYGKSMVIEYIIGDAKSNMYVSGFYIQDTYRRGIQDVGLKCPFIIEYNGKTWKDILKPYTALQYAIIESICMDTNGNLYAAGGCFMKDFEYYVAKWDGKNWAPVMVDKKTLFIVGDSPRLCTGPDGTLYVADYAEGHPGWNVTKWDGKKRTALGDSTHTLDANGTIRSICCDTDGRVYVAGDFTNQHHKNYVAVWDGKNWSELGGENSLQANKEISVLCIDNKDNLYAAGNFTNKDNTCYVAHWDGKSWSELGGTNTLNANNPIMSICIDHYGNIYAAGHFSVAGRRRYIAVFRK
jgi:hypothetical protein